MTLGNANSPAPDTPSLPPIAEEYEDEDEQLLTPTPTFGTVTLILGKEVNFVTNGWDKIWFMAKFLCIYHLVTVPFGCK